VNASGFEPAVCRRANVVNSIKGGLCVAALLSAATGVPRLADGPGQNDPKMPWFPC